MADVDPVVQSPVVVVEGDPKPPVAPKEEPKPQPKAVAKTTPTPKTEAKVMPDDADDDTADQYVDDEGMLQIPFKAFKTRIARARKSELKSIFGTDDRNEILKIKTDHEKLVSEREKSRREQQSELEREREDRKKAEERAKKAEETLAAREEAREIERTNGELETVAQQHFSAEYTDYALTKFKAHLRELDEKELDEKYPDGKEGKKAIDEWFADLAKKHSKLAKPAPKAEPEKKVEKKKLTNGNDGNDRPDGTKATGGEKAIKDMTKEEIRRIHHVSW
jgi:hypothetical protein